MDDTAVLAKLITELTHICRCLSTEKDMQWRMIGELSLGLLHKKKEGSNADATANQSAGQLGLIAKAPPQRTEEINQFPCLELCKEAGAFADNLDQQVQVAIAWATMNGKGPAQQRVKGGAAACHDELAGPCLGSYTWGLQNESKIVFRQLFLGNDNGFFLELRHGKRYNCIIEVKKNTLSTNG